MVVVFRWYFGELRWRRCIVGIVDAASALNAFRTALRPSRLTFPAVMLRPSVALDLLDLAQPRFDLSAYPQFARHIATGLLHPGVQLLAEA